MSSIMLTDQLGPATTSVDETSGQPVTRRFVKPFGQTRGTQPAGWPDRRSYLRTGVDEPGAGSKPGKAMGVFGVLGDLAMFWDMSQDVQRGCGGRLPDCVTPQEA
ncbi:hypothetical protein ACVB8X_35385 [Streptomyces sp. NRAIS4]